MFNELTQKSEAGSLREIQRPTFTEQLMMEKERLEARLQDIDSYLQAVNKQPETKLIVDLAFKISRY